MPLLKTNSFLFILLVVATFACQIWVDRYQQVGPELLTGNWSAKVSGDDRIDVVDNELTLFSSDPRTGASVHQYLPPIEQGAVLMFSAEVKCDNVVPGKKPWSLARLILVQNDGEEDRWDLPLIVTSLTGTHDWKSYHNFFYMTPETQSVRVIAELNQSTGSLQVRNMQLYPVSETQAYLWIRNIILISWGAFFLLLVGSCLFADKRSTLARILLASAFISIVIGTSLPGYMKDSVSHQVETQIDAESPAFKTIIPWDLSKVWHVCFFFLLGLILGLMLKKQPVVQITVVILMMAGGTEIVQLYIDGRTPLVTDFFIDSAGGMVGILLIRLFTQHWNNVKTPST
ncbi:VanZ family protein [Nitrosomonas sp.]|uniref:VanZ family protein n=1 Tax=Nitrosomonas sp. TaxID=42353 RepID=UPI002615E036|nr:VanZ family protein [Nitrosomonas sp.]